MALLLGASLSSFAQADKEKEAIKAVILKETVSFMNVDFETWSAQWVHAPYSYWSFADSSGSSSLNGWDMITKSYAVYFKTQRPSKAKITEEWIEIRVYGNGAYARFIQRMKDELDTEETSQVRVLEKKDGVWKIVCVCVVAN